MVSPFHLLPSVRQPSRIFGPDMDGLHIRWVLNSPCRNWFVSAVHLPPALRKYFLHTQKNAMPYSSCMCGMCIIYYKGIFLAKFKIVVSSWEIVAKLLPRMKSEPGLNSTLTGLSMQLNISSHTCIITLQQLLNSLVHSSFLFFVNFPVTVGIVTNSCHTSKMVSGRNILSEDTSGISRSHQIIVWWSCITPGT